MKVLVLNDTKFEEKDIDGSLESLQKIVGGYIELVYLFEELSKNKIDLYVNEEGKYLMPENVNIYIRYNDNSIKSETIVGPCLFASYDDNGNTIGLTDEQIEFVKSYFSDERYYMPNYKSVFATFRLVKYVEI